MEYSVGIDIGASYIKAGLVDEKYNIEMRKQVKAPKGYKGILEEVINLIENILTKRERISNIGIGVPGLIDKNGKILFCDNLDIENEDMVKDIENRIKRKVYIENDADCALIGEYLDGAAKGYDNVLMLTLGTGIGSSVLMNGQMLLGTELGHMTICLEGKECTCGSRGCLEAYCKSHMMENDGDKKKVNDYVKALTAGIRNGILAYDPEIVILGGGISSYGDKLINLINYEMNNYGYDYRLGKAKIKTASLLNDAGIVGASSLNLFKR